MVHLSGIYWPPGGPSGLFTEPHTVLADYVTLHHIYIISVGQVFSTSSVCVAFAPNVFIMEKYNIESIGSQMPCIINDTPWMCMFMGHFRVPTIYLPLNEF